MVLAIAYLVLFLSLESNKAFYIGLDTYFIDKYQAPYAEDYSEAATALDQGNIALAIVTLTQWSDIKKGDRIFPQKRSLLFKLAGQLHKQKKHEQLLTWAQIWQALDSRDITARAYYLEALRLTPEQHKEGVEGLALSYKQFPGNLRMSRFYADSLREAGKFEAAEKIHSKNITRPMVNWELFWDTGHGFNASEKSTLKVETVDAKNGDPGASHSIDFTLPADTQKFRLDLPAFSELEISKLSILINQRVYPVYPATLRLVMMQYTDGKFVSSGDSDPFIVFDIKNTVRNSDEELLLNIKFTLSNDVGTSG